MKKRLTALDGGLHELTHAANETDILISDTFEHAPTPAPIMGSPRSFRQVSATRPTSYISEERISLKIISALGAEEALSDALEEMGCEITTRSDQVLLVNVPKSKLLNIGEMDAILRAEAPRRLRPAMDLARGSITKSDIAVKQHPHLTGKGVVVGVMDTGVDWRHDDFINNDGSSRIELFMHAHRHHHSQQDIYSEYTTSQINRALKSAKSKAVPLGDPNGHGTHCASIAAGNGRASPSQQYRGIAPEANIMAMRSDTLHDPHSIEAIARIFDRAGDRPAVVNLSLGGHIGPHDGTSALESFISSVSGEGRIVVVAAGNEAGDRIHFDGTLVKGSDLEIPFTVRDAVQWIDIWIPRGDEADISIVAPDGTVIVPTGKRQSTRFGDFRADLRVDRVNGDTNLTVSIVSGAVNRRWQILLHATKVVQGEVHAWGQTFESNRSSGIFMTESSPDYSIGMPATEERAISVGSFISRSPIKPNGRNSSGLIAGGLSPFSSHGPTRTGVQRPDICAPGQHIVAALAQGSEMATASVYRNRRLLDDKYISIQGTSMSAPFVTGVIALMLQRDPYLTPEDIRLRFRATAQRDKDTGPVWNSGFGYGKIDVEALLNYNPWV